MPSSPLPVVIVAGFLGSGKTTLMRRLIEDAKQRGLHVAVVVNEFGAADVDSNILREAEAELIASIAGGCACCSGQDDLHDTLLELGLRPQRSNDQLPGREVQLDEVRPDVVLVEASGLADPVLLLEVMTAPQLLPLLNVASIVAVVDGMRYLDLVTCLGPLLRRQMQLADVIILNKIDIAGPQLMAVERKIAEVNARAIVELTEQCRFDPAPFWQRTLAGDRLARTSSSLTDAEKQSEAINGNGADAAAHQHYHTVVCPLPHPVERSRLEAALQGLPPEVWRAKGFVRLRSEPHLQLVQYTGSSTGSALGSGRYQIAPFYLPIGREDPSTSLVFIGSELDRAKLLKDFSASGTLLSIM